MPVDPRVQRLIEEMIESGSGAEEVCRETPELLRGGPRGVEANAGPRGPPRRALPGAQIDRRTRPTTPRRRTCPWSPAMT